MAYAGDSVKIAARKSFGTHLVSTVLMCLLVISLFPAAAFAAPLPSGMITNVFTVTFLLEEGEELASIKVGGGEKCPVQQLPQSDEEGKVFVGWYYDDENTDTLLAYDQETDFYAKEITADLTVTAKFKTAYNIEFMSGHGSDAFVLQTLQIPEGESLDVSHVLLDEGPVPAGKIFTKNWLIASPAGSVYTN